MLGKYRGTFSENNYQDTYLLIDNIAAGPRSVAVLWSIATRLHSPIVINWCANTIAVTSSTSILISVSIKIFLALELGIFADILLVWVLLSRLETI